MATYLFRCPSCAVFERRLPMESVTTASTCPSCGASAARVYTAPGLTTTSGALDRAVDAAGSSADNPHVTRTIPAARSHRQAPPGTPVAAQGPAMSPAHPPLPQS